MRFIENGPEVPDELLTARDAGQVVFFCGAGVSQEEAHLPNFSGLAGRVLTSLGSALNSPARRLFTASQKFEHDSGLKGIVATDRVFGLLEQEFHPGEVRQAVAEALLPPDGHGLGMHQIMLDLSRDPGGVVRLITTNFDRLFEDCDSTLASLIPPHLPDPRRPKDFRGIVHIHGCVDDYYRSARDNEFVLSSADFGRAYLADGWATRYIQLLLGRFNIVFVGYSADDPPVQYLLEALSRSDDRPNYLYAFQSGGVDQAAAQWKHKGVQPIHYDDSINGHAALWDTLRAWARRAKNPDAWHEDVIAMAAAGPAALRPYERGIVAHLAATSDGARRLVSKGSSLSAEWLCVFDPRRRYALPGPINIYEKASERFDPFETYGLDSDRPPPPADPDDRFSKREAPNDAWDLFASTNADRDRLQSDGTGCFRDADAATPSTLPTRLGHLGAYLVQVAHQPAAIWWAAHQQNLHPRILSHLQSRLRRDTDRFSVDICRAWLLLIAAWRERRPNPDLRKHEIEANVAQSGWSTETVRDTVEMYRPLLVIQLPIEARPPTEQSNLPLERMLRPDVEYPRPHGGVVIPPEHLAYAISLFRGQIEHAIVLEKEVRGHDDLYFDTTRPDDGEQAGDDGYRLTGHLVTFLNMMSKLAKADPTAAKAEFDRWPSNVNQVFTRLRIWAASQPAILEPDQAASVFLSLDEESFWNNQQEPDLLYAIRDRWSEMNDGDRQRLEHRLLTGSFPWPQPRDDLIKVNAYRRLNRLQWLTEHGVKFSFNLENEMAKSLRDAPEWEPRFAERTAQPHVGRVRSIQTDTDPAPLEGLPVGRILEAAREAAGRDFENFVDHRPFLGLAKQSPALALAVLTDAARKGNFPEQEWAALLHATSKDDCNLRLLRVIGGRLARLKPDQVAALRHPVSEWMRDRATLLIVNIPEVFHTVWDALAVAMAMHPPKERFRRSDANWVDDGLNQPAGCMVDALFKDPAKADLKAAQGLPDRWKRQLDQLLALPGDARRHAIAMISPRLNWLYYIDPDWSERQLLVVADRDDADAQAFWGGYFWAAQTPHMALYLRLKPAFIALAQSGANRRDYGNKLAGMLLAGWAGSDDPSERDALIPDVELREVLIHAEDELRTQMLWYLLRWSNDSEANWGDRILPFLKQVWPRQRAVRTPRTSGRLVELALAVPNRFLNIIEVILPLLGTIGGASLEMFSILDPDEGIAAKHPLQLLDLLWKVLPEDPWLWPYETRRTLEALALQPEVQHDPRLAELNRREQNR